MNNVISKINFDKAGYYVFGLGAIVLLGFWHGYISELIAGTSRHASLFHFHGVMMSLWIAMLIVQPILIRKKKFAAHRLIGKFSFVVMPLLVLSILQVMHYEGLLFPEEALTFLGVMNGSILMSTFYLIAIANRSRVAIHARAMVCTGITMIQPASDRVLFHLFKMEFPTIIFVSWAMIYALLIVLIVMERKEKAGRWVFPFYIFMHVLLVDSTLFNARIPGVDPAFGKWFLTLSLTTKPTVVVKDLPIPKNEIDRYPGEWGEYDAGQHNDKFTIHKHGDQLWGTRIENGKPDSTRLLYQGNGEFIPDKYKPFARLIFRMKDGKAEAFTFYYGAIGRSGQTKRRK
ncbi:hypothetical protein SAMN04488109_4621 [Chryseolinea serpens]|uniref:Uncharacterized protein n=1 Tax=Chryseolinea serpens TaxID=947013 RepID=A0A1M5UE05_9BACT|nr:hypothetical protein [Chryseolinea serpens]SHH61187.1 hypothetical protein SAMN04488109_4621 [Chryseolinea serpens]